MQTISNPIHQEDTGFGLRLYHLSFHLFSSSMLLLLPTDTCYWLAGDVSSSDDYHEIYSRKGRTFDKRLAILVRDFAMLLEYAQISPRQIDMLRAYPHPWSIVIEKSSSWTLPDYLDPLQYSHISFRVAEECIVADIRDKISYPLFLTSANLSGARESTTLAEAESCFPGVLGYDGWICDLPPSDIFSFGIDNELIFLRKNSR